MNWDNLIFNVATAFLHFGIIYIAYKFPKIGLPVKRKKEKQKADAREKITTYIIWTFYIVIVCLIGSYVISFSIETFHLVTFLYLFAIIYFPCIYGLYNAFKDDAKLTTTERLKQQDFIRISENSPD